MSAVFTLDKTRVRRSFGAASRSYDRAAHLQRAVGRGLLVQGRAFGLYGTVLDLGCGTGFLTGELLKSETVAHVLALDIAMPMLQRARHKLVHYDRVSYLCADAERLTLMPASVDRIFSNLALQWCRDLPSVFKGCRNALKSDGVLVVSTFGPRTLWELKQAWAAVDGYRHVNEFFSEDELTRFITEAGLSVMRLETRCYRPVYASVLALMQELKTIGAGNASVGRNKTVTTKNRLQRMISAYPAATGGIAATFEVMTVVAGV